jgi:hypothetical protein
MPNVTVVYRDGRTERFEERGRAGGSYTQQVRYHESFLSIVDEWGKETAIPADLIQQVIVDAPPRSW